MYFRFTLSLLLFLVTASLVQAQLQKSPGPPERIKEIVKVKNRLFAGSVRLFYSDNNGDSWEACPSPFSSKVVGLYTLDSTLFVSSYSDGIFMSEDLGKTWKNVLTFQTSANLENQKFLEVNDSTIILCNIGRGIYISTNKGRTWSRKSDGDMLAQDEKHQYGTTYLPNSYTYYLTTSTNYFANYSYTMQAISLKSGHHINDLILIDSILFIATRGDSAGVYRSGDFGKTWEYFKKGFDSNTNKISELTYQEDTMYASTNTGVYYSADKGLSWISLNYKMPFHDNDIIKYRKFGNNRYALTKIPSLLVLSPQGEWKEKAFGINDSFTSNLFSCRDTLFATSTYDYTYYTTDGIRWNRYTNSLYQLNPRLGTLKCQFQIGNTLLASYLGEERGLFRSTDNGNTWERKSFESPQAFYTHESELYIVDQNSVSQSLDQGETWKYEPSNDKLFFISDFLIYSSNAFFVASSDGVFKSTDKGKTWQLVLSLAGHQKHLLKIGDQIIVGSDNGYIANQIFVSKDQGLTWEQRTSPPTAYQSTVLNLYLHHGTFIATTTDGIFLSTDTCQHWKKIIPSFMPPLSFINKSSVFKGKLYIATDEGIYSLDLSIVDCIVNGSIDGCGKLSGWIYRDENENCKYDSHDTGFSNNAILIEPGPFLTFANDSGFYSINLPYGNYKVTPVPDNPLSFIACPSQGFQIITLDTLHSYFDTINFAKTFAIAPDVWVSVYCAAARPGFDFHYIAQIGNRGTVPASGNMAFAIDPRLQYISSTLSDSLVNDTLYYQFKDLAPQETINIDIHTKISPQKVWLGDTLISYISCKVPFDFDTLNNAEYIKRTVTGSYDPNAKYVNPLGESKQGLIELSDSLLNYTIQFQNVGTDTAFTVVITDTIISTLDIRSFRMGASSHPYKVEIRNGNVIRWTFNDIKLPDSTTNAIASQGYVKFYMRQSSSNQIGDVIKNTADIFFDYNSPVRTNTTLNTIGHIITNINSSTENHLFTAYPNPFTGNLTIDFDNFNEKGSVEILDLSGKVLYAGMFRSGRFEADLSKLNAGMYFVKVKGSSNSYDKIVRVIKK